jgi:hypothetical protein
LLELEGVECQGFECCSRFVGVGWWVDLQFVDGWAMVVLSSSRVGSILAEA